MSTLVSMLLELHQTRGSGVVRAQSGKIKKQVVVHQGLLASTESNQPGEHLAIILLNLQFLSRKHIAEISRRMKDGEAADQAVLSAANLDPDDLLTGARNQAIQILASLLAWDDCELHYYAGEGLTKRRINLQDPLPQILLRAAREASSARVSAASGTNQLSGVISHTPASKSSLMLLPLDSAEAYAYSLASSPITVDDLIALIPSGTVRPEEIIRRLLFLGLIQRGESATSGALGQEKAKTLSATVDDLLRKFELSNAYEILSVTPEATEDDIRSAYHELARKYHPDKFQNSQFSRDLLRKIQTLFTHVVAAHAQVSDTASRAIYDETRLKKDSAIGAALQARAAVDLEQEKMAETLFRAGHASFSKGEIEKAIGQFRECVWLRPEVAKFCHYLGVAQSELPKYRKEAEQNLLKAITLNEMGTESRLALGKLYLKVNLPRRAESQFQEALLWDPDNREALALLESIAK